MSHTYRKMPYLYRLALRKRALQLLALLWKETCNCLTHSYESHIPYVALSLQVTFRKRALQLLALLWKETCNCLTHSCESCMNETAGTNEACLRKAFIYDAWVQGGVESQDALSP